jgi:hypothetical protein
MRTPGRCTNHESCWLANGGRDIWVPVGDDFVCPVCAEPLTAPSLQAISTRSMAMAAAASVALVALAGGAGFGLVRAITYATHGAPAQSSAMRAAPQIRTAARQSPTPGGTLKVASLNTPSPAPAAPPAPVAPKAATTPAPSAPTTPAATALASAQPPAPTAAANPAPAVRTTQAVAPPAPATPAPATAVASAPPAKPQNPVVAQNPAPVAPAAPRGTPPQQTAAVTPPTTQAPPAKSTLGSPKPEVAQAGMFQKAPQTVAAEPETPAFDNPDGARSFASGPIVAPVRPFPSTIQPTSKPRSVEVAQAITYGQPRGPEGEGVDSTGRWRHRAPPVDRSGFLPGPGSGFLPGADWSSSGDAGASEPTQPYQVAQGDAEESAAAAGSFDSGTAAPNVQNDTAPADAAEAAAAMIATGEMPRLDGDAGAATAPPATPAMVTRLTVPAMAGPIPTDLPAQRVDVAAANAIDDVPDAPYRLAQLPPAAPAKLVLPVYPSIADDLQEPGRVDVGCIITVRGEPDDCAVTRRLGGPAFADSVLNWLHSGEVRYRPHLVHGHPVPELRRYDVKFIP